MIIIKKSTILCDLLMRIRFFENGDHEFCKKIFPCDKFQWWQETATVSDDEKSHIK